MKGLGMQVTVSIDVPTIDEGIKFFGAVFGFTETARPHPGYAMLKQGDATIGLLAKPAGSSPAKGSNDVRRYERHWTPVHVDFRVDDFEATLERALANGAKAEQVHRVAGFPPVAFCSDPFGHGFCIVGVTKL
ncbi:MAG TPA: VOC family protein [Rhizomicrobium sp.]|nr:VOC family protein [Rhizomicrobium sp.]